MRGGGAGEIHSDERDKMKWRTGRNQPNGAGGKMTGWGKLWLRGGGRMGSWRIHVTQTNICNLFMTFLREISEQLYNKLVRVSLSQPGLHAFNIFIQ